LNPSIADRGQFVVTSIRNAHFFRVNSARSLSTKQRWGRIINIASVLDQMGNAGQSNYATSKAGLIGITKTVARE
jgi:3-oxoacyl-[acyl-carrier protein] reductase